MKSLNKQAFTIIELMVSIAIIAVVTGIFLVNYNAQTRENKLIQAANDLASTYRLALNNGLGLVKYNNSVPAGGWGVNIDINTSNTSYMLFGDVNNNQQYNSGEGVTAYGGKTINLPDGIIIETVLVNTFSGAGVTNYVDAVFTAPHPTIYLSTLPVIVDISEVFIVLKDEDSEQTKFITVNFLGLVDISDPS